jgi:drug/metabolite transporter (DMT)-like permease
MALAVLAFFLLPFGGRARIFLGRGPRQLLVLILLLAGLVSGGIGCSNNTTISNTGTPLGEVTLKVTAMPYTDNVVPSQTLYFTVNVTAK